MRIKCKITGDRKLVSQLHKLKVLTNVLFKALHIAAQHLQVQTLLIVPQWRGFLFDSCFLRQERLDKHTKVYSVGYTEAYAWIVHEVKEFAHGVDFNTKHARRIAENPNHPFYFKRGVNEVYKFLERPYREHRNKYVAMITYELRKRLHDVIT